MSNEFSIESVQIGALYAYHIFVRSKSDRYH